MQFSIIVLFISFFLFLYTLHIISKDDFIIIRKDIPMENIFNTAFLVSIVALFFARFSYVIFNPSHALATFLGFLALPYFPGLYLAGGVLGGSFFLALYTSYKKLPVGRFFDFFILSFSVTFPFGSLGNALLSGRNNLYFSGLIFFIYLALSIIFLKLVFPYTQKNVLKEGSLGILYLISLSVVSFFTNLAGFWKTLGMFEKDNLLWMLTLIICIIIVVKQELVEKSASKK
jgi:hypothetical protein